MDYTYERSGKVSVFSFNGELTSKHEDSLKLLLMKVIHSVDRSVLNLKKVNWIDLKCLKLIRNAYCASVRIRNPIIIIPNMKSNYSVEIFNCGMERNFGYQ